ncbi:MAG: phenylalanine--tRNA ligase subunit alpha [Candidatus Eremiobacteraeota bacterium]|nr:phenylalanine--tRNA ligase subunit alpha [Candidatus Eremiobacteraeota bacterium]
MSHHEEIAERLHPLETQILLPFKGAPRLSCDSLAEASGLAQSQLRTAIEWLLAKNLIIARDEGVEESATLTRLGEQVAQSGFPEAAVLRALEDREGKSVSLKDLPALAGVAREEASPLIGSLKKQGAIDIREGVIHLVNGEVLKVIGEREALFRKVREKGRVDLKELTPAEREEVRGGFKKRTPEKGFFRIEEKPLLSYELTGGGRELLPYLRCRPVVNQLTSQLIASGKWRDCDLRKYDITLNPPRLVIGKKHPYRQFLERVRAKLIALGFEEMKGSVVETEFWDMDALFMPQFHSARNIHDVYFVHEPRYAKQISEPFLSQVAASHEHGGTTGSTGWSYCFDREKTKRLILRSQGTALSARTLASGPSIPGKYFAIARCFRYEQIDVTHGTDFFQIEGIVVDRDINFRKLLGLLKLFAKEVAQAQEIKFAPAYFPFTEPSVELHAKHPQLGWMELGGAGIFRPEVTSPLNVDVPVIAWGLGIDRMAMVSLGIKDIRQLFTHDLEFIRQSKVVF